MKAVHLPADRAFIRYIEIPGEDPPLLWLHGWQCSSTGELLGAAVQPALHGRRSLVIDLLGHGYSDKPLDFPYTIEAHARTVEALIDALGLDACGVVGHSMGGAIGVHVAAAKPGVVSLLIMAEAAIDPSAAPNDDAGTESDFVERGFAALVAAQTREAIAAPASIRAAHLEMTRMIEPRALHRERVSMDSGTKPPTRSLLAELPIPRWYLIGELSDPEALEADLGSLGVGWKVVAKAGHPMALQNPEGFAERIAEAVSAAWES
jgi:pimeloyl-ACP methyl ester carboxylesterase